MSELQPLTAQSLDAWAHIAPKWQIIRLAEMASMFEKRLAELDPNYQAYPFGRTVCPESPND